MSSSLSGRKIGAFDVGPLLGAGGMGEVYRARDTRLNREVAIKVLLPSVAADSERLARFNREAQVLASLNHPSIAHIHGVDDSESGPLLILEFVDGPTLADRLAHGRLPVDEAVAIAKQLADALEAAHERGVIHRDLKPANIKVDETGSVKVLDFGLAKALDSGAAGKDQGSGGVLANSPTITSPAMTQAGVILGTAAYMSPEQAKGRVVDKRTDVWAFGCVLFEMIAGKRAFEGEDVTETIAAVVRGEPDWSAVPANTPKQIQLLIKRCLDKDRRTRVSDIGVARFLLNETVESTTPVGGPPQSRRSLLLVVAGLLAGAVLVGVPWTMARRTTTTAPAPVRFLITPSAERPLVLQGNDRDIAMAPDASVVIYRSGDTSEIRSILMVRSIADIDARELPGSENARQPLISPDGKWVAFFSQGELRKVPIAGGGATLICRVEGVPRGATWSDDGTIIYAARKGLMRVSASGGEPALLIEGDPSLSDMPFAFPHALPGGKSVVFTVPTAAGLMNSRIEAMDIATGKRKVLVDNGSAPSYIEPGYLVFGTANSASEALARARGTLRAVRFDAANLDVVGDPITLVEPVTLTAVGAMNYSMSRRGDLVFVPGGAGNTSARPRALVWVDRKGHETSLAAPVRAYAMGRISPDGTRVALDVRDQTNDIWVWDITRQTLALLNRDPGQDMSPVWTPDSRRIIWGSTRHGGNPNLFAQRADGTGSPERLTNNATNQFPTSVSPDGKTVVLFGAGASGTQMDIYSVGLDTPDRKAQPLISTPAFDLDAEISPDGRWIAYHSNDSGEPQVYVRPFPNVNDSRTQISPSGGSRPAWSRDGRELFYLDKDGLLTSVPVRSAGAAFTAGTATKVLDQRYYLGFSVLGLDLRAYDVAPDGKRFLMLKDVEGEARAEAPKLTVVLNGATELQQRLPRP